MPTPSPLDAQALNALLQTRGETASFRGASVSALVDRLTRPASIPGRVDASPIEGVTVWLMLSQVTAPRPGEIITDSNGFKLRITRSNFIGHSWECLCSTDR
jgi:hypothetical protein